MVMALSLAMAGFTAEIADPAVAAPAAPACVINPAGGCAPAACLAGAPSAATCDYTDPIQSGCKTGAYVASWTPLHYYDAENGRPTGPTIGELDNWYSPRCGTNWAEFKTGGPVLEVTLSICINGTHCAGFSGDGWDVWSDQIFAPTTLATAWAEVPGPASGSVTS
jgi:hypothetical protein